MDKNDFIFGIRTVIEAIEAGKSIDKVLIKKDLNGELAKELFSRIKEYGVVSQRVPIEKLNRITMKNHQGVVALLSPVSYFKVEQIVPTLYEEGIVPLIILLDGITDTRNFGAIARTAECAGVNTIVIPERNSVSVNADAVKTSAGALLHIPVCREVKIVETIKYLKECGFNIVGATEKGSELYTEADFTVPTAIVMGAEDKGISDEVLRLCDNLSAIPLIGNIGSLNVSVAAGIIMFEAVRQRLSSDMIIE